MMVATEETCNRDAICALAMLETREENAELKKRVAELEGLAQAVLDEWEEVGLTGRMCAMQAALSPKDGE